MIVHTIRNYMSYNQLYNTVDTMIRARSVTDRLETCKTKRGR